MYLNTLAHDKSEKFESFLIPGVLTNTGFVGLAIAVWQWS